MLVKIARRLECTVASLIGEDGGSVDDGMAPRLAIPGAVDLLNAFAKIDSPVTRRRILDLMTVLAGGDPDVETESETVSFRRKAH